MKRKIFYGYDAGNEGMNRKNQVSIIWVMPIVYLVVFLIFFFIKKNIFSVEKIYINAIIDLNYIFYVVLFIMAVLYVIYVISFLFQNAKDFRMGLFRYTLMFLQYILLLPIILLIVSNNSLIILISSFTYIFLFFLIPTLKYVGKRTPDGYIRESKRILQQDYSVSALLIIFLFLSSFDMVLNQRDNLLHELYGVPIVISYLFYLFSCIFIFPEYTQKLWINISFSPYIIKEINNFSYEQREYDEMEFDNTKISEVKFSLREVQVSYEDESKVVFDQSLIYKRFYNIDNEQISVGLNGLIAVNDDGGMVHAFIIDNKLRKLVVYDSRFSNLVARIKTATQTFQPNKSNKYLNLLLNICVFISLLLACNWFPAFFYLFIFQYLILCKMEYLKSKYQILLKVFNILLISGVYIFLVL